MPGSEDPATTTSFLSRQIAITDPSEVTRLYELLTRDTKTAVATGSSASSEEATLRLPRFVPAVLTQLGLTSPSRCMTPKTDFERIYETPSQIIPSWVPRSNQQGIVTLGTNTLAGTLLLPGKETPQLCGFARIDYLRDLEKDTGDRVTGLSRHFLGPEMTFVPKSGNRAECESKDPAVASLHNQEVRVFKAVPDGSSYGAVFEMYTGEGTFRSGGGGSSSSTPAQVRKGSIVSALVLYTMSPPDRTDAGAGSTKEDSGIGRFIRRKSLKPTEQ